MFFSYCEVFKQNFIWFGDKGVSFKILLWFYHILSMFIESLFFIFLLQKSESSRVNNFISILVELDERFFLCVLHLKSNLINYVTNKVINILCKLVNSYSNQAACIIFSKYGRLK